MISRRLLLASVPALVVAKGAGAAISMTPAERLQTMIRMRGSIDGRPCGGWLDAVRVTVIDGEIVPFCRMLAGSLSRFEKRGDMYEATTMEVCYYLHPETGALLENFQFPGATESVPVPVYRSGVAKVRFSAALDEWEEHDPIGNKKGSVEFAPKSSVHLVRGVGLPKVDNGSLYLRADEYGRVYPDRSAPPTVFYREWMTWRARAKDLLESDAPSVPADFIYAALSSWRPWMKMGKIKGNTAENGHGAKVESSKDFPEELRDLLLRNDPDVLRDPVRVLG